MTMVLLVRVRESGKAHPSRANFFDLTLGGLPEYRLGEIRFHSQPTVESSALECGGKICEDVIHVNVPGVQFSYRRTYSCHFGFFAAIQSESLVGRQSASGRASGSKPARRKISRSVRGVK